VQFLAEKAGDRRLGADRAAMPGAAQDFAEVENVGDLDTQPAPEQLMVVAQTEADLEDVRRFQDFAKHLAAVQVRDLEQVGALLVGQLHQMRAGGRFALAEGRPRLGVEADHRCPGQRRTGFGGALDAVDQHDVGQADAGIGRQFDFRRRRAGHRHRVHMPAPASGRRIANSVRCGAVVTPMVPPWARTMERVMASPRPLPSLPGSRRTKRSKMRSTASGGISGPELTMLTTA
jgi:hypothetical protein